jgi:aspartyl-tRNA(Asn)/glutamyl-tRNA(Gln) amidotransferase subunit A
MHAHANLDELARALRAKEISSVELTKLYLARLAKFGDVLGAVVTITHDRALREAAAADADIAAGKTQNRPLLGIPYGVKDLLATKDIATTWGAQPYRNQVFDYDAAVVEKLASAGAVLVAKLAMVELAGGFGYNNADASFTGPGRTPWNRDFWSGGSSSGPAAAVAAGLVPFAIGSETSGSIITPAAFSGVTGFRPTYGAVSRHGAMALSWSMDKIGPMARNAADCNTIAGAIMGEDPRDPTTSRVFPSGRASWISSVVQTRAPNKRIARIGLVKGTWEEVQPAVRDNFLKSVEVLKSLGHTVTEVEYPDLPYGPATTVIIRAEGASAFEDLLQTGRARQLRAVADRTGGFASAAILATDYLRAMRIRAKVREELMKLFESVDILAAPARSTVAYPIGPNFNDVYKEVKSGPSVIASMNLLGAPGIAVPNGFGENNLPTAIQFNGAPANDPLVLNVAIHYQQATDHHTNVPPGYGVR